MFWNFREKPRVRFSFPFELSEWPTKLICKICNTMWDLKTNPKFIQEHDNSKEHKKNVIRFNLELNFLFVSKSRNRRRIIQQKYVFCKIYKCDFNTNHKFIQVQEHKISKKHEKNGAIIHNLELDFPFIAKSLNDPTKVFYKTCMLIFYTQLLNSFKNIRIQWYTRKMSSHLKKCNKENNEELCFCGIPHILKYYVYGMVVLHILRIYIFVV